MMMSVPTTKLKHEIEKDRVGYPRDISVIPGKLVYSLFTEKLTTFMSWETENKEKEKFDATIFQSED